jgi:hypothetical protein
LNNSQQKESWKRPFVRSIDDCILKVLLITTEKEIIVSLFVEASLTALIFNEATTKGGMGMESFFGCIWIFRTSDVNYIIFEMIKLEEKCLK